MSTSTSGCLGGRCSCSPRTTVTFTLRLCEHSELDRVFLTDRPVRVRRAARRVTALPAPPMPTDCPGWPPGLAASLPACRPSGWLRAAGSPARPPPPPSSLPVPSRRGGGASSWRCRLTLRAAGKGKGKFTPATPCSTARPPTASTPNWPHRSRRHVAPRPRPSGCTRREGVATAWSTSPILLGSGGLGLLGLTGGVKGGCLAVQYTAAYPRRMQVVTSMPRRV